VIATVDPNPLQITRDARGYVGIVGDVKLQQIADPCVFSVNQTSFSNLSRFGGPMEVTVTIPNGCGWETWSLTEGIVRVDSPLPEDNPAGTGQIHMYLLENTAAGPRIGRVHVGKPYSVYESLEIELIQCGTSSPVCPMGPEEDPDDDLPPPNGNDPGGDSSFFHLDALGSVRMVTDVNQQILGRYDYQPFGQDWETTGSSPATNTLRFTAKERDLETAVGQWQALDYSGARYYQSQTGRFTSVDPVLRVDLALSNPQRWNRFANAGNNPVRFVDPDGRDWVDFVNGVANAIRSNLLFGLGRSDGNADFRTGQAVGDVISVVQGALEVLGGVGTTGAGVVACGTGAACLVGAPAAVAGDLVTAHGVGVVAAAGASLMKSSSDGSGSSGGGRRTTNEDEVFGRLEENHGIKRADASQRLHRIKKDAGRRGADNVEFDLTGNVYDPVTGEWLGSLTEGGGSHP
jgi:RHS repeat-associated protein